MTPKILNELLEELTHLQEAKLILELIWSESALPYDSKFSPEVQDRMRKFFNFDDNE